MITTANPKAPLCRKTHTFTAILSSASVLQGVPILTTSRLGKDPRNRTHERKIRLANQVFLRLSTLHSLLDDHSRSPSLVCMVMRLLLVVLLAADVFASSRLDRLTDSAMEVLATANLGTTIRQCSCDEDAECVKVMQDQAKECADNCWKSFSQITSNPQELYNCISDKMPVVSTFIRCISNHLKSCVNTATGPMIPKVDLRKMFDQGEQKLLASRAEILSQSIVQSMRPIAEAALKFGGCVKQCFVHDKNSNGFCYDGKKCQPLVTQKNLRHALRTCLAKASWKNHAFDLCECAKNAGVEWVFRLLSPPYSLLRAAPCASVA
ncbi:hypothetical protein Y032_0110g198 [Ancylostoma ceylanicum]|uniref:Uncharacterized protein n=1 Tax=Ancylostoma ceylanicum TaxID=53326 RepID=A0A016TEL8_9BILA|nr:hypothetical protein Y032_0110g198 [Ancylostoma ceylanicum]